MDFRRDAIVVVGAIGLTAIAARGVAAQPLNKLPPARAPCSVLSGRPCHPAFCGAFHRGPCFPQYQLPFGENLQLTIVSNDDNDPGNAADAGAAKARTDADKGVEPKPLNSIGQLYGALRGCWVPPPKEEARHGMEYTVRFSFKRDGDIVAPPFVTYASHDATLQIRDAYRDAVNAALARCTPLHFSDDMGDAVAGRPIAIRFVDNRTIAQAKSLQ